MDLNSLELSTNFSHLDWLIVAVYLVIVVAIGIYTRKFIKNATDFIVAGRGLRIYLAIATLIGTELGLVTVMYSAQKGFTGGFAAFHIALAASVGALFVGLSGFIVLPLRRMNVMTIPEYYERRFGRNLRILGGIILAGSGILNMGMFIKAGSLFVAGITGLTSDTEIKMIMTALFVLVLLYTTLGGMVSIVVLDYIQFVILSVSLLWLSLLSIQHLGWNNIMETMHQCYGEEGFNPFIGEGFGPSYVLWMLFLGVAACSVWQTSVIRACSAENPRLVKKIFALGSIGYLIRFLIPYFLGISALVFIYHQPDLKTIFFSEHGKPASETSLMAMPVYLSKVVPIGFIGFITAGMLAAFMSTHDSYLLCWSSVLTQDVVSPWFENGLSSKTRLLLTRIFIVLVGLFVLLWGLWYPLGQDLWDYMAISGSLYIIGAFTVLCFGIYWKRTSKTGAYLAMISSLGCIVGLTPVQKWLGFEVSSAIVGLITVVTAIVLIIVGSLVFPDKKTISEEVPVS
jgi:SSS family solute:Na+ symporter